MSLKSRLQKHRDSKSFSFTQDETDCDLLAYFKEHPDIDNLTIYSHDKIYSEKNGITSQLLISFSSEASYLSEIERICKLYDTAIGEQNPHIVINMANNVVLNIYTQPMVTSEPFISFSRKKSQNYEDCFSKKLLSTEMVIYLRECMEKQVNIFIAGNASVDKTPILNLLAGLVNNENKLIICEKGEKMTTDKPCCVRFSKSLLNNVVNLQYDNIFCTNVSTDELIRVFKLIVSGYNGFIVSLSVKNGVDILPAIRNMLLLANINLFEENADFMVASSLDVVISTEKTEDGDIRISKISEMSKNKANEVVLKDIFVWSKAGYHLSTGNVSRYFNSDNSKRFEKEYVEESHKHRYIAGMLPVSSVENKIADNKAKFKKLKDKIKQKKAEKQNKNEFVPANDEMPQSLSEPVDLPRVIVEQPMNYIVETEDFADKEPDKEALNIEPSVFETEELEQTEVIPSSNEGILASETDDFSDDSSLSQPKIRNILDEMDNEETEEIEPNQEQVVPDLTENDAIEASDTVEKYNLIDTSQFLVEDKKIVEEPELFDEIKDINIDDFVDEDDDVDITEEDI